MGRRRVGDAGVISAALGGLPTRPGADRALRWLETVDTWLGVTDSTPRHTEAPSRALSDTPARRALRAPASTDARLVQRTIRDSRPSRHLALVSAAKQSRECSRLGAPQVARPSFLTAHDPVAPSQVVLVRRLSSLKNAPKWTTFKPSSPGRGIGPDASPQARSRDQAGAAGPARADKMMMTVVRSAGRFGSLRRIRSEPIHAAYYGWGGPSHLADVGAGDRWCHKLSRHPTNTLSDHLDAESTRHPKVHLR